MLFRTKQVFLPYITTKRNKQQLPAVQIKEHPDSTVFVHASLYKISFYPFHFKLSIIIRYCGKSFSYTLEKDNTNQHV